VAEMDRVWFISRISQLSNSKSSSSETNLWKRRMRSLFGVTLETLLFVWREISPKGPETIEMEHLLMALYFLKVYPTESVACGVFKVQEKTWRIHVKIILQRICDLNLVSLMHNLIYKAMFFYIIVFLCDLDCI
jgi:hypothetical protein